MATGRRRYSPDAAERARVRRLAGFGLGPGRIAELVVNPQTGRRLTPRQLKRHFKAELRLGPAEAEAEVAGFLFHLATGVAKGNAAAARYWLERCAGWGRGAGQGEEPGEAEFGERLTEGELLARLDRLDERIRARGAGEDPERDPDRAGLDALAGAAEPGDGERGG